MKDKIQNWISRRSFLVFIGGLLVALTGFFYKPVARFFEKTGLQEKEGGGPQGSTKSTTDANKTQRFNIGVDPDGLSRVYMAQGRPPEENMRAVLKAMGGIEEIISPDDIVIMKPNAQWWAQGMTNTNSMKAFIEEVLEIPGFRGEIIICDNHQFATPNSRAWTTQNRNGDYNYNELIGHFQSLGFRNVTKYHWQCAGPNPNPLQGNASLSSKRVRGPQEGDGYAWREDIVYVSPLGRKCMLTYPIFTSNYSGTTIDLKDGAWKDGSYTNQPLKLINFSVLNHHGPYAGLTASVKNFMGIVDMTCGFQGETPPGFYNTHFIGIRDLWVPFLDRLHWRIQHAVFDYNHCNFCYTGTVLGRFMREIRAADLNIITAHWVGYGSRLRRELSGYPKALLASRDPVALDYCASKEVLMPLTIANTDDNGLLKANDVTDKDGPSYKFLHCCHTEGIGNLDSQSIRLIAVS